MFEFWTKLVDWVKQPPRIIAAIALATAIIIFAPVGVTKAIHLDSIQNVMPYIGFVFVLCCSLLVMNLFIKGYSCCHERYLTNKLKKFRIKALQKLTLNEKQILLYYIEKKTKTQELAITDGVAAGLEANKIIGRATSISREGEWFDYNIQPWAWEHLNDHPELLESKEPVGPNLLKHKKLDKY